MPTEPGFAAGKAQNALSAQAGDGRTMCSPLSSHGCCELNWECSRLRNHWSSLQKSSSPDTSSPLSSHPQAVFRGAASSLCMEQALWCLFKGALLCR